VPLVAEARKALEQLRTAHPNSEFVFVRKNGKPVKNFRKAWELALERAGLKDKLFHGLRRGVTTNLAEAGVPEQTAMAFTGHKDIATHRRYRQLMQTNLVNAAKALASHMKEN
jgi:integrase